MTIPTLALLRNASTGVRLGCLLMALGASFLHGQCPAHGSTTIEEVLLSALKPEERRTLDSLLEKLARQANLLGGTDK